MVEAVDTLLNSFHPKIRRHPLTDGSCVVSVSGELDLYDGPDLSEQLLGAIRDGCAEIVVDLSEATFIDSTTLGILMLAHKRLRPLGGIVRVVCHDRNILHLFHITAFDRMFVMHGSLGEAVEAVAGDVHEHARTHAHA